MFIEQLYVLNVQARVISVCPNDDGFVAGMKDGTVRVFDAKMDKNSQKIFKKAKEWISEIKFSPDGTVMVVGSHDNALYAYKWPSLKPMYISIIKFTKLKKEESQ